MNIMDNIEQIELGFTENTVFLKDSTGCIKSHPLTWFPKLMNATMEQRANFTLSPFGIHWEDLDEDLSLEGFYNFKK
jgi:Protein of unknown function (DUF2442)